MRASDAARFIVVQHAEKQPLPGDPGLTELGYAQASRVARCLATAGVVGLYASPQRRARETAAPIALVVGVDVTIDVRLSERMNWEGPSQQTAELFYEEWRRTVVDRDYVPSHGDSSAAAASRFEAFLDETGRRHGGGPIAMVTHGGVTIDVLRSLLGDERLHTARPGLVESGMPPCALTTIAGGPGRWRVLGIGKSCRGEHQPVSDLGRPGMALGSRASR